MYATLYVKGFSKVLRLSRQSREAINAPERVLISREPETNNIIVRACPQTQFGLKVSSGYISANGFLRELWHPEEVPLENVKFYCSLLVAKRTLVRPALLCVPQDTILRNLEHEYYSILAANPNWDMTLWDYLISNEIGITANDIWEYSPEIGWAAAQPEPEWL